MKISLIENILSYPNRYDSYAINIVTDQAVLFWLNGTGRLSVNISLGVFKSVQGDSIFTSR